MFRDKIMEFPIYRGMLCIIDTDERDKISEKYKIDLEDELFAFTLEHYVDTEIKDCYCIFVILNTANPSKVTTGIIAHEAFHAANFLLNRRGHKFSYDNDEAHAYLVEWIAEEVQKFLDTK